ncbi:Cation/H(+) antiporter 15 [Cocos nucifera]|uniref:Cation/H(+) antiporter 15 n=1 Tax=Cocos nucifera TaxID=13894 RepID=A0A8K0N006_COCNU|nr:Cation/H(+) antiporter 15 [Cocos nucifera]
MLIIATTRTINFLLRPFRQPRYISEILGGFVLGPSVMGRITGFSDTVFPLWSLLTLNSIAHIGLIYSTFLVGLEIVEVETLSSGGPRSLGFTAACVLPPLAIASKMAPTVHDLFHEETDQAAFLAFLGVAVTVTAFTVLARILAEMKLIGSDVGRIALSCAGLEDVVSWTLLATAVALAETDSEWQKSFFAVLSAVAFYTTCRILVRPVVVRVTQKTTAGEEVNELHLCGMLVGVIVAAFISDSIGMHAIYGAFLLGIMVPNGPFGEAIADKVGDLVNGLLMPLFLVISGLRMDLSSIENWDGVAWLVLMVLFTAVAKVMASVLMAALYKMPLHDGLSVGLLMNSKGVTELVFFNIARDKHIIEGQTFTILVLMSMLLTVAVSPLLTVVVKPVRRLVAYKRRTIWWSNPESELRILACVHTSRQATPVVSLLDISHPTKRAPIYVYVLHLVELTGRAAAMLVVNSAVPTIASKDPHHPQHLPALGRIQAQSDAINHVFESYEQHAGGVTVQCLTAVSPYATMHEDIIAEAMDRHAALIILPFHKHQTVDGGMEVVHQAIRSLNQAVLEAAPCSVGIFIDRGLGAGGHRTSGYRVALLFFGGADDREALAFAGRMVGHPKINLKVVRFLYGGGKSRQRQHRHRQGAATATGGGSPRAEMALTVMTEEERERRIDENCLGEFQARWSGGMVEYDEVVAINAEETVAAIRRTEEGGHDLFVVGRGQNMKSPLLEGLNDWSEFPELGPAADLLVLSEFEATASVLVVRCGGGPAIDMLMSPDSPRKLGRPVGNKGQQWSRGSRV